MRKSLKVVALLVLAVVPAAYVFSGDAGTDRASPPTLVVNLTSGEQDLHAVAMGLHFAEHGLADGRRVVLFFNVKSPPFARRNLADSVRCGDQPPIKQMIGKLLSGGVRMVVCPMCAQMTGVKAEDLVPGIDMIQDRKQIFDELHANSVVFTY
jgi:predicted peroxiredoxin